MRAASMSDDLLSLGAGNGSANEAIKFESRNLRGTLAQTLDAGVTHFEENDVQLLKFHGSYQQEDRDQRRDRKAAGLEKAYQFMVRSRIPGGVLTAEQYLAHDAIAERYGNRSIRLTTRQGIQLHGVLGSNLRPAIRAINEILITTLAACGDVNRNVMACPTPPRTAIDAQIRAFAERIAERLSPRTRAYHEVWIDGERFEENESAPEHEPVYGPTYLPRKFKIGVAAPHDNCIDAYTQDIAFVADAEGDALHGFTVLIGGGMGSTHGKAETYPRLASSLCFALPEEVLEIAECIVTIQRDYGDRKNRRHARMKYLVEERGIPWFREELERRLGRRVADPREVHFDTARDHLGWHEESDGRWYLGLHVSCGRIVDGDALLLRSALRDAIGRYSPGIRITGRQDILLTGIASADRAGIDDLFARYGVTTDPGALGLRRYAIACPALPTCGLAVAEAERALPAVIAGIAGLLREIGHPDETVEIRMTGCPNGCARPRMGDIGIVGRSLGIYDLFVGGDAQGTRINTLYAKGVALDEIPAALRLALERWVALRCEGEAFGDFAVRFGVDQLREAELEPA
jgi:sulfite reductase (ferredoxin)